MQQQSANNRKQVVDAKEVAGVFHGYAATWDVDTTNERFKRGAFAKSIMEKASTIPVLILHARDGGDVMEQVGVLTGAHEDEVGLAVSGRFYDDSLSQGVYRKVLAGSPNGLSVGFVRVQGKQAEDVYEHSEVKLIEVTITNKPANSRAKILDAKTAPPGGEKDKPLSPARAENTRLRMELELLEVEG